MPVGLDSSGFLYDAIWEKGGTYTSDLSGDPSGTSSYVLVTSGYAAQNSLDPTSALPNDGKIVEPNGTTFQLQPYDQGNVDLISNGKATIALLPSSQASYSEISFLVSNVGSFRALSGITFTLNYTDGTYSGLPMTDAVLNPDAGPSADAVAAITMNSYILDGNAESTLEPISLSEYDFNVAASPAKILQSVTIDPGSDQIDLYAISGTDPTPEPPAWLLLLSTLVGWPWIARRLRAGSGLGQS